MTQGSRNARLALGVFTILTFLAVAFTQRQDNRLLALVLLAAAGLRLWLLLAQQRRLRRVDQAQDLHQREGK